MSDAEQTSFSLEELSQRSGVDMRVIRSFIEQGLLSGPTSLGRYARYSRQHLDRLLAIKILRDKQDMKLSDIRLKLLSMSDIDVSVLAGMAKPASSSDESLGSALEYVEAFLKQQSPRPQYNQASNTVSAGDDDDDDDLDCEYDDESDYDLDIAQPPAMKAEPLPTGNSREALLDEVEPSPLTLAESIRRKIEECQAEAAKQQSILQPPAQQLSGWGLPPKDDEQRISQRGLEAQSQQLTPVSRLEVGLSQVVGQRNVRKQAKREMWYHIPVTKDIELSVRGIQDEDQLARLERVADFLRELLSGGNID